MNDLTIFDLTLMVQNKEELLSNLRGWGLIPQQLNCSECGQPMKLYKREHVADGYEYCCTNKISRQKKKRVTCGKRTSIRTGTFFGGSQLSILQILIFVNLWVDNASLKMIGRQAKIRTNKVLVNWASYCREVLLEAFIKNPVKIGGPGMTVEIDECKFGKRKYHSGHRVEGQWVFGGFERETGRIFMVPVDFRDRNTLLPIIKDWIAEGTTIISDCWKAYDCLESEGFRHLQENHSLHFKDPESGAHTNVIESSWRDAKNVVSSYGRKKAHIPGNLARYMFQKRCNELKVDRTVEFFRLVGQLYDPNKRLNDDSGNPDTLQSDIECDDLSEELE